MNDTEVSSDDAIRNYYRECESRGFVYEQVNQPESDPELYKGFWMLRNINGDLARVDAETGKVHF